MAGTEPPQQRFQGVQKESAGYRLLKSMGWEEGQGLGASKQGIKEHIRVKKNFENWGVGAVTAADRARDWSLGMVEFHRVLSNLSEINSQHANPNSEGSELEDDTVDERYHLTSQKDDKAQKKRKKESIKDQSDAKKRKKNKTRSPCASTDARQNGAKAAVEVKKVKLATHIGRFKKRESAKMVKNYSEHDLAAILGGDPFAAVSAAACPLEAGPQPPDSDSEEAAVAVAPQKDTNGKKVRFEAEEQAVDTPAITSNAVKADSSLNNGVNGSWWLDYFVRAGRMGSLRPSLAVKGTAGFSEADQTNLYNSVHDGAAQGRVGLGRSSMPKKVGGARWAGKRTKISGSSDSEGEENGEIDEDKSPRADAHALVVMQRHASAGAAPNSRNDNLGTGQSDGKGKKMNWRKLLAKVLVKQPDGMKMKSLLKAVMKSLDSSDKKAIRKSVAAEEITEVIQSSSKFVFDGEIVRLAVK